MLFQPPNVSGWDYAQWLDTSRWAGRLEAVNTALSSKHAIQGKTYPYGINENAERGLRPCDRLLGRTSRCQTSPATTCSSLGRRIAHGQTQTWEQVEFRQLRQNALRKPDPDDSRLDDGMSNGPENRLAPGQTHCDGFTRSQAIRRVLASGKPPSPASGTRACRSRPASASTAAAS